MSRTGDPGSQRHRRGDAGGLAHRHAGRDFARDLLGLRRGRVMPAGDQQPIDALRQHRAIRRVVVTAAGDAVGKCTRPRHVFLGDDVLAVQQPGLPDAGLRRDIHHVAVAQSPAGWRARSRPARGSVAGLRTRRRSGLPPSGRPGRSCAGSCTTRSPAAASSATNSPRIRR